MLHGRERGGEAGNMEYQTKGDNSSLSFKFGTNEYFCFPVFYLIRKLYTHDFLFSRLSFESASHFDGVRAGIALLFPLASSRNDNVHPRFASAARTQDNGRWIINVSAP